MVRRLLLRAGDYIFVLRPLILVPAWSMYVLGARAGGADAPWSRGGEPLAGLASLTAILATAYLLNQIFDQESDRLNEKGHYLTRGIFGVRTVLLMAVLFFAAASFAFRSAVPAQRPFLVVALVLSLVYSLPPLRLCARPIADLAANAVGYGGVAFAIGYAAHAPSPGGAVARSIPYVALVGATFLHTTILDVDGDRAAGKRSSTVLLGVANSAAAAVALVVAGLAWAVLVVLARFHDPLSAVVLAVGCVLFGAAWVRLRGREAAGEPAARARVSSPAVQWATVLVTVPAVIQRPWYLAVLVPLVLVARAYYRARFGLTYPGTAAVDRAPHP